MCPPRSKLQYLLHSEAFPYFHSLNLSATSLEGHSMTSPTSTHVNQFPFSGVQVNL